MFNVWTKGTRTARRGVRERRAITACFVEMAMSRDEKRSHEGKDYGRRRDETEEMRRNERLANEREIYDIEVNKEEVETGHAEECVHDYYIRYI